MAICKFFAKGSCNRGPLCPFEHINPTSNPVSQKHVSSKRGSISSTTTIKVEEVITHDLLEVKIEWPLSCYGLNTSWESGGNIISGDISPEEARLEAYGHARLYGNIELYKQQVIAKEKECLNERLILLQDIQAAIRRGQTPLHRT